MTYAYHEPGKRRDFCFYVYFTTRGIILSLLYYRTSILKKSGPSVFQHFIVNHLDGTKGLGAVAFLSHSYCRNLDNKGANIL